ncbi:hypothetical protein [Demequina aurantiaca]|uniref:hypothetical protein n=1 Tax=Demequina aurantiaca TaxID=676200 RepID=UPI003D33FFA9
MFARTKTRLAGAAVLAAILLAACSGPDQVEWEPSVAYPSFNPSSEPNASTDSDEDSTASAQPTPSETPVLQFALATDSFPYDAYPMNANGTALSGCSPGSSDSLPDGVWYGVVQEWGDDSISFDLACLYHPKSPEWAAYLDSLGPDEPQREYPTTNDNPGLRELPLAENSVFWSADYQSLPDDSAVPYSEVQSGWGTSDYYVYVNDGEVTEVVKVYYP